MINLWKYEYGKKVKIVDVDNNVFIGMPQEVTDQDERTDEDRQEIGITVDVDGSLVEFFQSDIKSIEYA
nr:MAG TPA: hypothetical protein [Caudoviricetes sp.]